MRRMIMRTVPALLVFLLLFGFTACGRKLQNDTDIGNTAAVSSEDRPDKGKLSGDKGQAGQADQADQTDQTNQEYGGICAAGSHSCSIPWLSGGGGYHFSDTMDEKQRAGAGEGDAFYPDNSTGAHSGF